MNISKISKILIILKAAFFLCFFAYPATAQNFNYMNTNSFHKHIDACFKKINLEDSQKQEVKTIKSEASKDITYKDLMVEFNKNISSIVNSDIFDEERAKNLMNEYAEKQKSIEISKLKIKNKMFGVLNQEQRDELNKCYVQKITPKAKKPKASKAAKKEKEGMKKIESESDDNDDDGDEKKR